MTRPPIAKPKRDTPKRRDTVSRLVDAAVAVVAEKGFQRASLDEIAARAGLTKGAIYSNFDSKDQMFWAVLKSRRLAAGLRWTPGQSVSDNLRDSALSFSANLQDARSQTGFLAEFILYALSNDEARERWTRWYDRVFDAASEMAKADIEADNAGDFAVFWTALQSMTLGLMILHTLSPDLVTEELIRRAIQSLGPTPKQ